MKTIIAGSRRLNTDHEFIWYVSDAIHRSGWINQITEIVSGGARGIDLAGEEFASNYEIPVRKFLPNWDLGKAAGPIRNKQMADYVAPDGALILIWDGRSKGSASMLKYARELNLKVYVYLVT